MTGYTYTHENKELKELKKIAKKIWNNEDVSIYETSYIYMIEVNKTILNIGHYKNAKLFLLTELKRRRILKIKNLIK